MKRIIILSIAIATIASSCSTYEYANKRSNESTQLAVVALMKNSDFIYLATHGIADKDNPLDGGGIALSSSQNGCELWTPREIQHDKLMDQAIVILSACQTGLGQNVEAGTIGLARAFLLAGAQNVIMSLWSVDDKATEELMGVFMEELFKPQRFFPRENLRHAILRYKEINPDPAAWAPFISMGTPYPSKVEIRLSFQKTPE